MTAPLSIALSLSSLTIHVERDDMLEGQLASAVQLDLGEKQENNRSRGDDECEPRAFDAITPALSRFPPLSLRLLTRFL